MKDFDKWNKLKIELETKTREQIFHDAEIWWCSIGINIGNEEDGKNLNHERPVLILRKFNKDIFIGLPLSTKIKEGVYYLNLLDKNSFEFSVLLSQSRVFSSKRLIRKLSKLSRGKFSSVKEAYKNLLNTT